MQCRPAAFVRRLDACTLKCATQRRLRSLIEQNFQDDLRGNGEAAARVLEDGVNLFAGHTGEPGEKLGHGRAALEVFKEGSHGHTGATEEPFAADPSGDAFNRRARGPIEHAEVYSGMLVIGKRPSNLPAHVGGVPARRRRDRHCNVGDTRSGRRQTSPSACAMTTIALEAATCRRLAATCRRARCARTTMPLA